MGDTFVDPGLAPAEPAAPEPDFEPEPEAWGGPSQEEWQQAQQTNAAILQWIESQQPQPEEPEIDFYDERQVQAYIDQQIAARTAPINEWHESQQQAEGQERLLDIIADDVAKHGELPLGEAANPFVIRGAQELYPELARRYGEGDRAAEAAIRQSAASWRESLTGYGKSYHEREMNRLTNLAGAGHELDAAAIGGQQVVTTPGGDELSLVRKYGGIPT